MVLSPLFCDTCGAANQPRASFCRTCGHPLQAAGAASRSTATGRLLANHLLKKHYRILDSVGKGGMGAVYRAEDTQLGNRKVAIKEMSQSGLSPKQVIEAAYAFKQEAHILAGLQHPNLPNIYDHFSEAGCWYLVMSFIQGETLEDYLKKASGGKLPVREVLQIGIQLCTVLNYLHTQQPPIIFRDLKPSNIIRTTDGHLYLIDFGIARHFKPGQAKDTAAYGSRGYAAPEQYGTAQTAPHSDISTIPTELATLIAQMLELDEDKRPTSMLLAKQKLQDIAASPPPKVSPAGVPSVLPPNSNPPAPLPPTQPAVIPVPAPKTPIPPTQPAIVPGTAPPLNKPVAASSASNSNKPNKPSQLAVILIISVLVLAIVIPAVIAINHSTTQSAQNFADSNATATAQAQELPTNIAATAQAAAIPDPYQPAGTLALMDSLSQPFAWGDCGQFVDGAYQISSPSNSYIPCYDKQQTYSNFAFEVKMTIKQGDCGGLAIRANSDGSQVYIFSVCQNSHYRFTKYVSFSGSDAVRLTYGSSSAINQGTNQSNVIAVVANGGSFDLYVNGQKIDSTSDNTYSQGFIGLIAYPLNNQTVVTYQDVRVWTIQ